MTPPTDEGLWCAAVRLGHHARERTFRIDGLFVGSLEAAMKLGKALATGYAQEPAEDTAVVPDLEIHEKDERPAPESIPVATAAEDVVEAESRQGVEAAAR